MKPWLTGIAYEDVAETQGMPKSRMGDIMEDLGGVGGMGSKVKTVRPKKKTLKNQKPTEKRHHVKQG